MRPRVWHVLPLIFVLLLLRPAPAWARQAGDAASALRGRTNVWVTTTDGREQPGRVMSVSGSDLRIRIGGAETTIPLREIRRVEVKDGIDNGMLAGLIVGTGVGILAGVGLNEVLCDVEECQGEGLVILLNGAAGAAIGTILGAVVDGMIPGRRTVFTATGPRPLARLSPLIAPRALGLRLSVRW